MATILPILLYGIRVLGQNKHYVLSVLYKMSMIIIYSYQCLLIYIFEIALSGHLIYERNLSFCLGCSLLGSQEDVAIISSDRI